jgi:hypothetical protein
MTPAPKRRWLRFSLRTMFVVVTVAACWIGYDLNWIRQRREAVQQTRFSVDNIDPASGTAQEVRAPGLLWLFGEHGYAVLSYTIPPGHDWELSREQEAELQRVARLYPEAELIVVGPNNP